MFFSRKNVLSFCITFLFNYPFAPCMALFHIIFLRLNPNFDMINRHTDV